MPSSESDMRKEINPQISFEALLKIWGRPFASNFCSCMWLFMMYAINRFFFVNVTTTCFFLVVENIMASTSSERTGNILKFLCGKFWFVFISLHIASFSSKWHSYMILFSYIFSNLARHVSNLY